MDSNTILMSVQDKLPKDLLEQQQLKERLDKLDEKGCNDFMAKIPLLGLKNPTSVFWLGSFVFGNLGVGRFMIGDKILGEVRLAITILGFIFSVLAEDSDSMVLKGLGSWCLLITLIWWVADLFLVGKKLRKQNLNILLSNLP
ncbi:hypothetical protein OQH61_04015 [Helicobacter sp. MIT 21-1697]|uniref:hypothetical protein n=1 Tax=Helicobacter sp. MIT 21-1697 TaxID=2993733 RepID=UPI00224AD91A|nr:hypothetical protein [Helicobacter sp. MIT 21-1697]MCX2716897.1 hypothetical protein [Helicobacter sp. MIT 21-1697]